MRPSGAVPPSGVNQVLTLGSVASAKSDPEKLSWKWPDWNPVLPPSTHAASPTEPLEPMVAVTPCIPPGGVRTAPCNFPFPMTMELALVVSDTTSPLVPAVAGLYGPMVLSKLSVPTLFPLELKVCLTIIGTLTGKVALGRVCTTIVRERARELTGPGT